MDFLFLLLVTCCLFVRPSEVVPPLATVPVYEIFMVPCVLLSADTLLNQCAGDSLRRQPITIGVLGLWLLSLPSNLWQGDLAHMFEFGAEFAKVVVYYMLVAGLVNSRGRLSAYMGCVALASLVMTTLSVLHYRGLIYHPAFEAMDEAVEDQFDPTTGERFVYRRLCGPGFFHDPNDMCLILTIGIMFSLCGVGDRRQGPFRFLWLAPIPVFGYALILTHSRGGFLALMGGLGALLVSRFGVGRALALGAALSPLVLVLFGGRQLDLDTSGGTGQTRIQIWMDGLILFRSSPLFGIGTDKYGPTIGHVAHNSYIHALVELGGFGGIFFIGIVYYALWTIYRLVKRADGGVDPGLRRMGPYVLAALVGYSVGMLSLSVSYLVPTYAMFGMAAAFIRMANPDPPLPGTHLDARLALRLFLVGIGSIVLIFIYTSKSVRW